MSYDLTVDEAIGAYIDLVIRCDTRTLKYDRAPEMWAKCKANILAAKQSLEIPGIDNVSTDLLALMQRVLSAPLPSVV